MEFIKESNSPILGRRPLVRRTRRLIQEGEVVDLTKFKLLSGLGLKRFNVLQVENLGEKSLASLTVSRSVPTEGLAVVKSNRGIGPF